MRMERRSVLSPLAKSFITIVLSLAVGIFVGMTSLAGHFGSNKADSGTSFDGRVRGLEVSHCQAPIDWAAVRTSGFTFAWITATEGDTLRDPSFTSSHSAAQKALMSTGASHIFDAQENPGTQALHFVRTVGTPYGDLPPLLRIRDTGKLAADSLSTLVAQWIRVVKDSLGVRSVAVTGNVVTLGGLAPLLLADSTVIAVYDGACSGNNEDWWFRRCNDQDSVSAINRQVPEIWFSGNESAFLSFLVENRQPSD